MTCYWKCFYWKDEKIVTVGSNPDLLYPNLSPSPLHNHIDPPKFQRKINTWTGKLSFLNDISVADDPSPLHNFELKLNFCVYVLLSRTVQKRIICLIILNLILHLSWLKAWLPMVALTVKNDGNYRSPFIDWGILKIHCFQSLVPIYFSKKRFTYGGAGW